MFELLVAVWFSCTNLFTPRNAWLEGVLFFNPFVPNASFQGVEKGCIGNKWINDLGWEYWLCRNFLYIVLWWYLKHLRHASTIFNHILSMFGMIWTFVRIAFLATVFLYSFTLNDSFTFPTCLIYDKIISFCTKSMVDLLHELILARWNLWKDLSVAFSTEYLREKIQKRKVRTFPVILVEENSILTPY